MFGYVGVLVLDVFLVLKVQCVRFRGIYGQNMAETKYDIQHSVYISV